jgi:hypothetical protein
LVFALKKLKLSEPLKDCISDFRATRFLLVLNDGDVRIESFNVSLLALLCADCRIEVVADVFPWTAAVRLANIAESDRTIECDCHITSSA